MSFLKDVNPQSFGTAMNGIAKAGGADPGYAPPIAGYPPSSATAKFGSAMNNIASAGGADQGYIPTPMAGQLPQYAQPNNHLQFLDPAVIEGLMQKIRGQIQ